MKKGFTLVELSIVLVIIGLLTGGILVGQSLIQSAKSARLLSDVAQYNVAIVQFRQKFKTIPADNALFTPPGNPDNQFGNGANGNANCAASPNATMSNNETYQFWTHLSQAGMLKKTYVAYQPKAGAGGCTGGIHERDTSSKSICNVAWPCTELDNRAIGLTPSGTYPIFGLKQTPTYNLGIALYLTPENLISFVTKTGPLAILPNTYYNDSVGSGTGNNIGVYHYMCFKSGGGNPASCTSSDVTFGRVFYAFDLN